MHKDTHINRMQSQSGFTLIELMVALSITFLLIFLALPSFSQMLIRSEVSVAAMAIRSGLSLARSEAVKRGAHVQICSLSPLVTKCAGSVGVGRLSWDEGFMVFHDVDGDRVYNAVTDKLLNAARFSESLDISWGRGHYLIYVSSGRLMLGNSSFRINHPSYALERRLILNIVGRVRSIDI
jgi:prepilin-type N-terminal cleavage/methylation domain-containing protein